MTTGPDDAASHLPPREGETTEPDFPSTEYSAPAAAVAAAAAPGAGPRPELAWRPPPAQRPAPATAVDRMAAAILDGAVVLAILAATTVLVALLLSRGLHWLYRDDAASGELVSTNWLTIPLLVAIPTAAAVAYCSIVPGELGATVGMRALGLRLRLDVPGGGRVGARRSLLRLAMFAVGTVLLLLGPLSILSDPEGRAWHDRGSGTVVAHR